MDFMKIRWRCLIAAMILALFSGIGYSWSVFLNPLIDLFNWSLKTVSLTFTIQVLTSTIAPIFLSRFQKVLGVKRYLQLGILVYAGGLFATMLTSSISYFYISFGLIVGVGIAMLYPSLMAYSAMLFPEKTGLAAGLVAGAYGCGAVLWAPTATFLMKDHSVLTVYAILAVIFAVVMIPVSFFIKTVPPGFKPEIAADNKIRANRVSSADYTWKEMLKSYKYYMLLVILTFGATAGLMITGHAANILQESLAFTPTKSAVFVGLIAVANTLGRLVLGPLSDKIGRYNTMMLQFVIICGGMFLLVFTDGFIFITALLFIASSYGGFTAMISPVCADNFGLKHHAVNYTFVFLSYGFAGAIGPQLASGIRTLSGSYIYAFLAVAALSIIGFCLVLALKIKNREITITEDNSRLANS